MMFPFDCSILFAERSSISKMGRRGRDRMVDGFTTTYASSAYHH